MSLQQNNFISVSDFNQLLKRVTAECQRRNKQDKLVIPDVSEKIPTDIITAKDFITIFESLSPLDAFPQNLNLDYILKNEPDKIVQIENLNEKIIYALEGLNDTLDLAEKTTNPIANIDCRGNCAGLCTGCEGSCTSCTGCSGSCYGCTSCSGCSSQCGGCGACGGCSDGCSFSCFTCGGSDGNPPSCGCGTGGCAFSMS